MVQMNLYTKQKQTHKHREQICGCQGGREERVIDWEFGVSRCKLLHFHLISHSEVMKNKYFELDEMHL